MAVDLEQQLARLPGALQGLQDRAVEAAVYRSEQLVAAHLGDRHRVAALFVNIDGGGGTVTTGQKCNVQFPWSYEILGWTLAADAAGSVALDLRTATYDAYPTTASICGALPPALVGVQKNTSADLTGWTTLVRADSILRVVVDSAATVRLVTLSLLVRPV